MRVKLLVVLAIASAVFMLLAGTASACTATSCDGCGACSKCANQGLGFISPLGLTDNVASCMTQCPSSDVTGLEGVSSDLVSASGFVLPTFAGSEVGNEILGDLVENDFSTPDLVEEGFIPSFVPVETHEDMAACAVPSCVDFSTNPFLFEPNILGSACSNNLCNVVEKKKCDCDTGCTCGNVCDCDTDCTCSHCGSIRKSGSCSTC